MIFMDKTDWKLSSDALRDKQEELRALAAQLTLSEENTRRAIAADIHDRIGYELDSSSSLPDLTTNDSVSRVTPGQYANRTSSAKPFVSQAT